MSAADVIDPAATTRLEFERVNSSVVAEARGFGTATLHEASGRRGALPHQIRPVVAGFRVCGPAVTVHSPGGDNLWIHRAIYAAQPGDVLVVYTSGVYHHGYWGEIMSTAAHARGLGGLVIDGCVRDVELLACVGFPVFARGLCIRGTSKDLGARGWINAPLLLGDVIIRPGDLIVGDANGVLAAEREKASAVIAAAREREAAEIRILRELEAGRSTLEIYRWR